MNHFDPSTGVLTLTVALPPPDNHLHSGTRGGGRFATATYREWIRTHSALLAETLGEAWAPDTARWWDVRLEVALGYRQKDAQNHAKAVLDLLSGKRVANRTHYNAAGAIIKRGDIYRGRGLYDDDKRVHLSVACEWLRHPAPYITITARPSASEPGDYKAQAEARRTADRLAASEARQAARASKTKTPAKG